MITVEEFENELQKLVNQLGEAGRVVKYVDIRYRQSIDGKFNMESLDIGYSTDR